MSGLSGPWSQGNISPRLHSHAMGRGGSLGAEARVAEAGAGSREVQGGQQGGTRPGDHLEAGARGQDILPGLLGIQRAEEGLEAETEL